MEPQFKSKMEKVKSILENNPKSRSDDNILLTDYYISFHKNDFLTFIASQRGSNLYSTLKSLLNNIDSADDIIRVRRKFQQEGKYLADEKTANGRFEKEKKMRDNLGYNPELAQPPKKNPNDFYAEM